MRKIFSGFFLNPWHICVYKDKFWKKLTTDIDQGAVSVYGHNLGTD